MSFLSWFLFVIFGGIGLAALPLDLIYDFCTRPKKLSSVEIEKQKKRVVENSISLKELANEVRSLEDRGAKTKTSMKKKIFKKNFFLF
jgi:LMBR1 domain-containing protein 1